MIFRCFPMFSDKKGEIPDNHYFCEICSFSTKDKSKIIIHLKTKKHNDNLPKFCNTKYKCNLCDKKYNIYKSLWSHSKKCLQKLSKSKELSNEVIQTLTNEIRKLTDQNREVIEKINLQPATTNIHNGDNNQQFNLNLFLNEKCKDAINLTDFIDNLSVTNQHLENNAENGFVKGITKIILDGLSDLNIYERPIHCTDVKRDVMYVKDDDNWNKENEHKKLNTAIQEISRKCLIQFCQWKEDNPEYMNLDSESGCKYMAIQQNSMAASKRDDFFPKIIKAVAKETVIDKKECI